MNTKNRKKSRPLTGDQTRTLVAVVILVAAAVVLLILGVLKRKNGQKK